MKRSIAIMVAAVLVSLFSFAAPRAGEAAPEFTANDSNGKTHKLSDYKGKFVVLEWTNSGCPFTKKHYNSGNMQNLQKQWTSKGVVWLTVISSAPGKEGYMTPEQENAYVREKGAAPTAVLMDPNGNLGHLYGAKTTPHIFIVDPTGKLIYNGAIDDKPTTDRSDIDGAKNYVSTALTEAMGGRPVTTARTEAYGCSVKYQ